MSAHDGLGLNDDEGLSPTRPDPGEGDPEGAIEWGVRGSGSLLGIGVELMAEGEFNDRLLAATSEKGADTRKNDERVDDQESDHVSILRDRSRHDQIDSDGESGTSSIVDL